VADLQKQSCQEGKAEEEGKRHRKDPDKQGTGSLD